MHTLERSQLIAVPREELFRFFEDPRNLGEITPPDMGFDILKMDQLPIRTGFRIKYRIKVFGVPVTWVSQITEYERGVRFADVQMKGPYAYWRHEHAFDDADGGTIMHDRVQYRLPFGILGSAIHPAVRGQLRDIFDYRARIIGERFAEAPVEA